MIIHCITLFAGLFISNVNRPSFNAHNTLLSVSLHQIVGKKTIYTGKQTYTETEHIQKLPAACIKYAVNRKISSYTRVNNVKMAQDMKIMPIYEQTLTHITADIAVKIHASTQYVPMKILFARHS